jgi:hypothetical protein
MFSCRDATELMTAAEVDAMPSGRRALYGVHMVICAHCRAYRRQLREVVALAKEIAPEPPSPGVESRLREAFRAAFRAPRG